MDRGPGSLQSMGSQELDTTSCLNHHHTVLALSEQNFLVFQDKKVVKRWVLGVQDRHMHWQLV